MTRIQFSPDFLWGCATSAYQVEGSPLADGAGPSIWQRFVHTPGLVRDGDTGDVACDHYRRYAEDVALMSELGMQAYRFSVSWSRVLPGGTGAVNQPGLDLYDRLVDALLERGIEPIVTLYHWDLPAALDDRGGWLNPDIAGWFADYDADRAATARADAYMNRQYLDPALLGRYPGEMTEIFGEAWPAWPDEDFALIEQPIDFIGVNYYTRNVTRLDAQAWPLRAAPVSQKRGTYTETGWEVFPQGLTDTLVWVKERYGDVPIYITENGAAFFDPPVAEGGRVRDPLRVDYLHKHLITVHGAMQRGVDVRGYMAWSLLDNFEWSLGYSKRFGIVHVDFDTQQRTPKDSARFYSRVIATSGDVLNDAPEAP